MLKMTYFKYLYLTLINIFLNFKIKYKTDIKKYKIEERWTVNFKEGDCDDYTLTKLYFLITHFGKKLFNPKNLCIAECFVEDEETGEVGGGEGHLVLIVRTNKGDYVLDNRFLIIPPYYKQRYYYKNILYGKDWYSIKNDDHEKFKFRKTKFEKAIFNLIYFLRILFFGVPRSKSMILKELVIMPYGFYDLLKRKNKTDEEKEIIKFWGLEK